MACYVQVAGLGLDRDVLLYWPRSPQLVVLDVSMPWPSPETPPAPRGLQASAADIQAMPPWDAISCLDLSRLPVTVAEVGADAVVRLSRSASFVMPGCAVGFCPHATVRRSCLQAELLLRRLPALDALCLRGCERVPDDAIVTLGERHPRVHIHRGLLRHCS